MKRLLMMIACLTLATQVFGAEASVPNVRTIVLVRHGYYLPDPAADPRLGPHLAPIGVAQALLVGARLAGLPPFDAFYVSPMLRARDTAAAIAEAFPGRHFQVVDDLAECTPPTRRSKVVAEEKPVDLAACKARMDRVFARFFRPASGRPQTDLLVCHGNVIRNMVTRALGVDNMAWLEMSVGNASITRIRVEADGSFKVLAVGDVGHLPPSLQTGATGDPERSLAIPDLPVAPMK
ncbi:MAG: histidine phosphatase family protein [Rhodanobacter sp.]